MTAVNEIYIDHAAKIILSFEAGDMVAINKKKISPPQVLTDQAAIVHSQTFVNGDAV